MTIADPTSLWDDRRRVAEQYRRARESGLDKSAWNRWRLERDELLSVHVQSPIPMDRRSMGVHLPFFPYDPAWRIEATIEIDEPVDLTAGHSGSDVTPMIRFGRVAFPAPRDGEIVRLALYWLDVYGGGVFLPFRDETNGSVTYGAGRYLLDTIKGADLGSVEGRVVLDFNFAYHPSCVYDTRWSCPLSPIENTIPIEVRAGERLR